MLPEGIQEKLKLLQYTLPRNLSGLAACKGHSQSLDFGNMGCMVIPSAYEAALPFVNNNFLDRRHVEAQRLRRELTSFVALQCLKGTPGTGLFLTSGSAANELALQLARRSTAGDVLLCSTLCHTSVIDAARKLGMRPVQLAVDPDTYQVPADALHEALDHWQNCLAGVVATYGTTNLGTVEDLMYNSVLQEQVRMGKVWLHIDAAYGGLNVALRRGAAPFPQHYSSVSLCFHKLTGGPNCSLLSLPRYSEGQLSDLLCVSNNNYLDLIGTADLGTTQQAFSAAVARETIHLLGLEGLRESVEACYNRARWLESKVLEANGELLHPVTSGIVALKCKTSSEVSEILRYLYNQRIEAGRISIHTLEGPRYGVKFVMAPKPGQSDAALMRLGGALSPKLKEPSKGRPHNYL